MVRPLYGKSGGWMHLPRPTPLDSNHHHVTLPSQPQAMANMAVPSSPICPWRDGHRRTVCTPIGGMHATKAH